MENKNEVYILIRTKLQFCFTKIFKQRFKYFTDALESVFRQNTDNKINIIILQDCWWHWSSTPQQASIPSFINKIKENFIQEANPPKKLDCNIFFYTCNSRGAAHALYNIRNIMFQLSKNEEDITILLDDDDIFSYSGAVHDIVTTMNDKHADICVTQFENIGEVSMNIVNRGGYLHNKLVKCGNLDPKQEEPFNKGSICFADSLGWTKVYRVKVLKEYHDNLHKYFKNKSKTEKFLIKNDAFEDFPEIINLCLNNVTAIGLDKVTHSYRKHKGSITSSPCRKDFKCKRTNYLALLVGLYNQLSLKGKLKEGSNIVIARYCTVKILTIENILAKFRSDENTYWSLTTFKKGDFIRLIIETFRKHGVLDIFKSLLTDVNYLKDINPNRRNTHERITKNADSPFIVIQHTCENEAFNGRVDISYLLCDGQTSRRVKMKRSLWIGYFLLLAAGCSIIPIVSGLLNKNFEAIIGVLVPLITILYNIYRKDKLNWEKQIKHTEKFCDLVNELGRHVQAGLRVLLTIKYKMEKDATFRPAQVHFSNLKVLSHLMSTEWDNYIIVDKFNNLPKLRVNIRNLDNSAKYMEEYIESSAYNRVDMLKIIDWEIARYIGYITRFMFFAEKKSFILPELDKLWIYVESNNILEEIAKTVKIQGKNEKEIKADLENYFQNYIFDSDKEKMILNINSAI